MISFLSSLYGFTYGGLRGGKARLFNQKSIPFNKLVLGKAKCNVHNTMRVSSQVINFQSVGHKTRKFSTLDRNDGNRNYRQHDKNANYLVTGGNRGIGLQFVKSLLDSTEGTIIACCRQPSISLLNLVENYGSKRLKIFSGLDIEKEKEIERLKDYIKSKCGSRVDILFNVVGILHDIDESVTKSNPPERTVKQIDKAWLEKSIGANTIGPVMLIQALEPFLTVKNNELIKQSNEGCLQFSEKTTRFPSIVVNLSARVGSISDNSLGGWISYRMSKAALNMATKTISIEYKRKNIYLISIHPGTTDTDLSKPFQKNVKKEKLFTPEYSVSQMMKVVFEKVDEDTTGSFFAYDGSKIEW